MKVGQVKSIFEDMRGVRLPDGKWGYFYLRECWVHFVDGYISDNGEEFAAVEKDGWCEFWKNGRLVQIVFMGENGQEEYSFEESGSS